MIEPLESRESGKKIDVPGGIIHHWLATVFVPGVPVHAAVALMQDYDRHGDVFTPEPRVLP